MWLSAQESLQDGCKKVDEIVESFQDVGLKDRSMIWNTDLVEVRTSMCTYPFARHGRLCGVACCP